MKFPRYWAKVESDLTVHNPGTGAPMKFSCWGWSDVSRPEAEEKGRGRAKAVEEKLRQGQGKLRGSAGGRRDMGGCMPHLKRRPHLGWVRREKLKLVL